MHLLFLASKAIAATVLAAQSTPPQAAPKTVEAVLHAYVDALGGEAAVARITSRQLETVEGHRKARLSWSAPDRVLWVGGREREGFDGNSAWHETKRKRVQKLPAARKDELETDANPIRFIHLREMYRDLEPAPAAHLDGAPVDVLQSPNSLGATRLFFDAGTHLLVRVEERGVQSAYYQHTIEFADYKRFDDVQLPTRIVRTSDEPGAEAGKLRLVNIRHNVPLDPEIFRKPDIGKVVSGGKH